MKIKGSMYGFRSAVAALCALSIASTASAVVLQFTGELRVDDIAFVGPIPSFSIGDTFDFTMSLEDSALKADVNPNTPAPSVMHSSRSR